MHPTTNNVCTPGPEAEVRPQPLRYDWTLTEALRFYHLPFAEIIYEAQRRHREHFEAGAIQLSTLLNIKTGGCPEDCAYCPQSARYRTNVQVSRLMGSNEVLQAARAAKASGATRFCMGAAWRSPRPSDLRATLELVKTVKSLGLETCATLGMLRADQAMALKEAGLDFYNHNLDTSRRYYPEVIGTRGYEERLETLEHVRRAGMRVCCGGIIGMGEAVQDRCELLVTLACLPKHPESVPINLLVRVSGTPLEDAKPPDPLDFVRTIALARILMPASYVRLSAGRSAMSDELQALCFLAGANSVFYGEKLLTTANPEIDRDRRLFQRLGMTIES